MSMRARTFQWLEKLRLLQCRARSITSAAAAIRNGSCPNESLTIFISMHRQGVPLDSFSLLYAFKSVASLRNLLQIRHLHSLTFKLGLSENVYVSTSLLNGYSNVSWSDACELFDEMPERTTVTYNTMITGHLRNGDRKKAYDMFMTMPHRDASSWSTFISNHVNNGKSVTGLEIFREMMFEEKLKPDQVTLVSILSGCSRIGSVVLVAGRSVHGFMVRNLGKMNVETSTALVDMYARCGSMKYANKAFNLMQEKNVVTWTALICGSAEHGYAKETLDLFIRMQQESKIRPNELTFTGILHACANSGLVHEGRKYFKMMKSYGLEPNIHHIGCVVDLLGNAGLVEEAYDVIRSMKCKANNVIWGSFLAACKDHMKFEMAERVIEEVLRSINPKKDGGIYSLISDLYAMNQKWEEAEKMRKIMVQCCVNKARGTSFVRIK